jgi:RNA polymerase sigma-70 factor (ECF subfamily)
MKEEDVARWYADYGYVVFRRCLAYLGERAAAEDALQDVFVRALAGAATYRGEASPRTWLCRIADHLCIDLLRRGRRNPVRVFAVSSEHEEESRALATAMAADDHSQLLRVQRLMTELDEDAQRLAVLYFLDEFTQEELAAELGLSRRTIGKRLKALVERARSLLGEELTRDDTSTTPPP